MRKTVACITALLQLAFGVFLIANRGSADRARDAEIEAILQNGTEFLFNLTAFEYNEEPGRREPPISFSLYSDSWDWQYNYYPLTANGQGVAIFGASEESPPAEPYFAPITGASYCRIDADVLHTLFGSDTNDDGYHYYHRPVFQQNKNRFQVNGKWVPVYAVGTVYGGNVVFTGVVVDGERY